jgi:hypothetical protein
MTRDELIALRDQELASYYSEFMDAPGSLRTEAAPVPPKTDQRLAIGGRRRGKDNYDLVIRVQNVAGRAINRAKQIMERVRKEYGEDEGIDYAIVKRIAAPSQRAVAETRSLTVVGTNYVRPLSIGYSIGHKEGGPGTLGLFAKASNGLAAVSCNHVIALSDEAKVGSWIYQPGPPDLPAEPNHRIGRLANYRELNKTGSNYIDGAYCILEDTIETIENLIPTDSGAPDAGEAFDAVIDPFNLELDKPVAKIGRTTGYTSEPVENVSVGINDVTIEIPGLGNHRFDNMIEIEWTDGRRPFAKAGDSGSALYQEAYRTVFGLHIASGEITRKEGRTSKTVKVSYACPITKVMDIYELELL